MTSGLRLYEDPVPPTDSHAYGRIFAPVAYATVRRLQLVPMVHIEGFAMAPWFPVCWLKAPEPPTLIVVRTLLADGSHQPAGSPSQPASLPLALKAYPFVVGLDRAAHGTSLLIDNVVADNPTDVGAPVLMPDGKLGRGAEMRLRAASAFNQALPLTRAMTQALLKGDHLEPWPLEVGTGPDRLSVPDLLVIRPGDFTAGQMVKFVKEFGAVGASFLGAHRASLFRAGALVQAVRAPDRTPLDPKNLHLELR